MNKVTLRDFAVSTGMKVQEAKDYVQEAGALIIGFDNIYVDVDIIEDYMDKDIISRLREVSLV